ncbi:MAG: TrkH family potassium uptake protein [Arenicellales bacterium]|jgi:trk system potassium uptake protein TrkH|nr:potassium transporter [Gammaproteobacteria bacterium]MCH1478290.1 TrkH family potassium uptake protein [Arenicellales bacterium]MDC1073357.1 TrkH family potassium uptake protein [Gammaproteobacteria bacterium]MDC3279914.1 TrkH family potassium uptake protein [Gammaproteobacteria bacterium]MDG1192226.1 TrkH family potassium uptake protein [Arenicellales bacterium]
MFSSAVLRILGVLLVMFSTTMIPPLIISWMSSDGSAGAFFVAYFATVSVGGALWILFRNKARELRVRDGFLIVVLFWTVLAIFGTAPLLLSPNPALSLTDALFESMSGLTTTGATVLTGLDNLPPSILYYRQQLQWLGGMGIIVLAVAVMPMLGVGGMQLYRAETPGPMKDSKLTPRITETAKALWYIYLGLTVSCAVAYWAAGMTVFDAVGHAFSTVAIGGFSTHDESIGFFNNPLVMIIAMIFMLVSAINFALHFTVVRSRSISTYFGDTEVKAFMVFMLLVITTAITVLAIWETYPSSGQTILHGAFQVISIGTTTGFTTTGFHWWPSFLPVLLIIMSAVGGCAGSTAGGMKMIRFVLLYKQGKREIGQLIHPSALVTVKIGNKPVPDHVINAVWGFFSLYILSYVGLSIAVTATGVDLITAFSAVTACLNNLGPGLGAVAENYALLNPATKLILTATMLLGRLEIFTLLVLLTPAFWRS